METSVYPVRNSDEKSGVNLKNLNEANPFEITSLPSFPAFVPIKSTKNRHFFVSLY